MRQKRDNPQMQMHKDSGQIEGDSELAELPPRRAPYVPLPLDLLPQEVRRYIAAGAKTFDVDVSFFLLPILSGIAATIGNARSIRLKEDYIEPSLLWTANIAPTGDGKSPVLQEATAPMRIRERKLIRKNKENAESFAQKFAEWDGKKKSERGPAPEKDPLLTCLMDDTTIEAAAKRINDNPRGVLLAKDELSHWFESFDQYHDRAGSDVSRWLSMWTGNFFALDRVTGGRSYRIANPRLSIASCVVPEVFGKLLTPDYFTRGLPARFLFGMPKRNRPRTWIDKPIPSEIKAAVHELFARLETLQPHTNDNDEESPVLLGLDADAKRIFADFYNECARRAFESGLREAAQWAKLSGYAARLALVGQLAHDPDAEEITGDIMLKTCKLARWFGNEAERIFASLSETPAQRNQRSLLEFVERRGGSVTIRDVMQGYWRLKNQREPAEFELKMLAKTGFGKWEETHPDGPGRPTRVFQLHAPESTQLADSRQKEPNSVDVDESSISETNDSNL